MLELAEKAEPQLYGSAQKKWLDTLDREYANIRAALTWLREHGNRADGLRLAGALGLYWCRRGRYSEGHRWLEQFLASTKGFGKCGRAGQSALSPRMDQTYDRPDTFDLPLAGRRRQGLLQEEPQVVAEDRQSTSHCAGSGLFRFLRGGASPEDPPDVNESRPRSGTQMRRSVGYCILPANGQYSYAPRGHRRSGQASRYGRIHRPRPTVRGSIPFVPQFARDGGRIPSGGGLRSSGTVAPGIIGSRARNRSHLSIFDSVRMGE